MHDLSHNNICKFIGITVEVPDLWMVTEYCSKGSLQDLLANDDVNLDWAFKSSLILDLISVFKIIFLYLIYLLFFSLNQGHSSFIFI